MQLSPSERAEKLVSLAGEEATMRRAEEIMAKKEEEQWDRAELQWALKLLCAIVLNGGKKAKRAKVKKPSMLLLVLLLLLLPVFLPCFFAQELKIVCLRRLATFETSANGRNYLFTCAVEEEMGKQLHPEPELFKARFG